MKGKIKGILFLNDRRIINKQKNLFVISSAKYVNYNLIPCIIQRVMCTYCVLIISILYEVSDVLSQLNLEWKISYGWPCLLIMEMIFLVNQVLSIYRQSFFFLSLVMLICGGFFPLQSSVFFSQVYNGRESCISF